jgi:F-type H+-transporting ATPase subunit delta
MAIVDLRYARALDEVVTAQNLSREGIKAQLNDFLATFAESAPLREVFENPSIPEDQKLRVLDSLAGRLGLSRTVRNFLAVVIHHLRLPELGEIVKVYLEMADRDGGIADAEVTTARPLDEAGRRAVEESIVHLAGSTGVRAVYREDPALLGGAVIKVGSTVYDGSVRGQLEQIKQRMVAATA